jgi:hypothetical protein
VEGSPYRRPAPIPPDPYLVAWSKHRRRKRAWLLLIVVAVVAGLASDGPSDLYVAVFPTFPALLLVGAWDLMRLKCPHCGERFYTGSSEIRWGQKPCCQKCGIRAGTPKSAVKIEPRAGGD